MNWVLPIFQQVRDEMNKEGNSCKKKKKKKKKADLMQKK